MKVTDVGAAYDPQFERVEMSDKLRAAAQEALYAMQLARGDYGTVMLASSDIDSWVHHRVDLRLDDAIKAVEDALMEKEWREKK